MGTTSQITRGCQSSEAESSVEWRQVIKHCFIILENSTNKSYAREQVAPASEFRAKDCIGSFAAPSDKTLEVRKNLTP